MSKRRPAKDIPASAQPLRWRDDPQNQALVQQVVDSGVLWPKSIARILDFHEDWGSDPSGVFREALRSKANDGRPAPDMSKYPTEPDLSPFEADLLDRILGGEVKPKRIV